MEQYAIYVFCFGDQKVALLAKRDKHKGGNTNTDTKKSNGQNLKVDSALLPLRHRTECYSVFLLNILKLLKNGCVWMSEVKIVVKNITFYHS